MEMVTVSASALESIKAMAAKLQAERDELLDMCNRSVSFFADLNGAHWIVGDDAGSVDMRQRAKSLQSVMFKTIENATKA